MGTHLRVLGERYPMNTNMTGLGWFSKEHNIQLNFSQNIGLKSTYFLHVH